MVNYRRVVCEVAFLVAIVALTTAAPTPDCTHKHYDQRQNGSENYRLNIDGVVVAVAPAESLFSALGDMDDLMELLALEDFGELKPKPPSSESSSPSPSPAPAVDFVPVPVEGEKPLLTKPEEKPAEGKPAEEKPAEGKPMEGKPEDKPVVPAKPAELPPLSDINMDDLNIQKKEVSMKKPEKGSRLKNRLASFLVPLLRKARHHKK